MVGMQEIVLAPSPYSSWGLSYIRYQFFMGLGDAIPVLLLCLIIVKIYKNTESDQDKEKLLLHNINTATKLPSGLNWVIHTGVYVCLILMERIIMNKWKLIAGNYDVYPLETILWTIIFGITLGTMSWLLAPLVNNEGRLKKIVTLHLIIIGLNWSIFNGFIGMISRGTMPHILVRVGVDVVFFLAAGVLINKIEVSIDK